MSKSQRRLRDYRYWLACLGGGALLGAGLVLAGDRLSATAAASLVGLVTLSSAYLAHRFGGRVDEVALDGYKTAWLWGGWFGSVLGITAGVYGLISLNQAPRDGTPIDAIVFAALGGLGVVLTQFLCFGLALGGWWLWKSRP